MSEASNTQKISVERLREDVRSAVQFLADKLIQDLGDNLVSLSVVGSSLTKDFHPACSDINTVLVVRRRSRELLQLLASYGKAMGKKKLRAPLLMTPEYIHQSLDVFGVEFLDFQLNHVVVYGPDPFAELSISKQDVRLQCERQLKAALIKLRQGYISSMGKPKLVGRLLIECVAELTVLMRAMLWLIDCERPREAQPTLAQTAQRFEFEAEKIEPLLVLKQQHKPPHNDQVDSMFENVYQVIDHLSRRVDQLRTTS